MTKREWLGRQAADALVDLCHVAYNLSTARGIIRAAIARLTERIKEFKSAETARHATQQRELTMANMNLAEKSLGLMASRARQRPADFEQLSAEDRWKVDKKLGILDWDGDPST